MQGLLTLFSETTTYNLSRKGWKKKKKKNPKQPEEKAIPSGPWRQNYAILTSVRRRHVALTSVRRYFWRPTPAGILLKKVKAQPHMTSY